MTALLADSLRYTDQIGAIAGLLAVYLLMVIIDRIDR